MRERIDTERGKGKDVRWDEWEEGREGERIKLSLWS